MIAPEIRTPYSSRGDLHTEALKLLQKDEAYIGVGEVKDQKLISWFSQPQKNRLNEEVIQHDLNSWSMLWRLLTQSIPESRKGTERLSFMCLIKLDGKEYYLISTRLFSKQHLILVTEKNSILERAKFWLDRTANCIDGSLTFSSTVVGY